MAMSPTDRKLHAVQPGDLPPAPQTISDAVASGSSRDVLAAMRRALAQKLDDGEVSSNSIASAYKELRELDRLIRAADADAEEKLNATTTRSGRRSFNAAAL